MRKKILFQTICEKAKIQRVHYGVSTINTYNFTLEHQLLASKCVSVFIANTRGGGKEARSPREKQAGCCQMQKPQTRTDRQTANGEFSVALGARMSDDHNYTVFLNSTSIVKSVNNGLH